jgi:hypothetical protein
VADLVLDRRDKIGFSTPEQELMSSMTKTAQGLRDRSNLPCNREHEMLKQSRASFLGNVRFHVRPRFG